MEGAERSLKWLLWLALGLSALITLWSAAGLLPSNIDDALITLRYSINLVDGQGLVFNPGERVEGYSNPVWTLLLALPLAVGMDGLLGAKLLGMAFELAGVWGAILLAWELIQPKRQEIALAVVLGAGFAALCHPLAYWATAGLETPQYAALLVLALWRLVVEHREPHRFPISGLLAGLAAISRPEAPLLVLALVTSRGWDLFKERADPGARRSAAKWAGLFALPTFGWLLFRLAWYGALLPNTFHRKTAREASFARVWEYIAPWVGLELLFVLAAGIGVGALLWRRKQHGLVLLAMLAAQGVFLYIAGSDWMPSMRFVVPVLPLLAAAAGVGAAQLTGTLSERGKAAFVVPGVFGLTLLGQGARSLPVEQIRAGEVIRRVTNDHFPGSLDQQWGGSLEWVLADLAEVIPPDATLAYTEVGMVGYGASWRIIDLAGLITAETAGATGLSTEQQVAWVREQRPEWMLLKDNTAILVPELLASDWIWQEYERLPGPREGLTLARRKDAPWATPEQVIQNLEFAAERAPRFAILQQRRLVWVGHYGTPAQRQALCGDLERYLAQKPEVLERCRESLDKDLKEPKAKLRVAPLPVAVEAASGVDDVPVSSLAERSLEPWFSPNGTPERYAWVEQGQLTLSGPRTGPPEKPTLAYACLASVPVTADLQLQAEWMGDGGGDGGGLASTVAYLRYVDADGELVEVDGAPARQRLHRGAPPREWGALKGSVDAPPGAEAVELCVTVESSGGQVRVRGWRFYK